VKCVVWDLDDTLWRGTLTEHDVLELQPWALDTVKALDRRGILQSVASKNHREDALARLRDFGLSEYFLYPQIHWNAKSGSIEQIRKKLNIGVDTFLFVDDQPYERDEVRSALPEVQCVDSAFGSTLLKHPRLNPARISDDAAQRRLRYLEDMQRQQAEEAFVGPPDGFLATLGMRFTIKRATEADLLRCEELTVRTNQLNSTGITYDLTALEGFMRSREHSLLVCELTDKYGAYGTIGLALVEHRPTYNRVMLLLMSCRTTSRGVGSVLLSYLMKQAQTRGKMLRADFRRTDRNRQMWVTYRFANFQPVEQFDEHSVVLENDLSLVQPYPAFVTLQLPEED
jgi:FkbH-like protein